MLQQSEFSQRTEFVTITEFIKMPHRVLGILIGATFHYIFLWLNII